MDKTEANKPEMTDEPEILVVPQPKVKGGLILFKKPSAPVTQPSGSRLGLDRLAAIRRLRAVANSEESSNDDTKRQRVESDDSDKDTQVFAKPSLPVQSSSHKERTFRSSQEIVSDTPDRVTSQLWEVDKPGLAKEKKTDEPASSHARRSTFDYPTPSIPSGAKLFEFSIIVFFCLDFFLDCFYCKILYAYIFLVYSSSN